MKVNFKETVVLSVILEPRSIPSLRIVFPAFSFTLGSTSYHPPTREQWGEGTKGGVLGITETETPTNSHIYPPASSFKHRD